MKTRRDQVLDAALRVLGTQGMRRLTHRAVDAKAKLPLGSTSNYFRSRDALILGILERHNAVIKNGWMHWATVRSLEKQLLEGDSDSLAEALGWYVKDLTGQRRFLGLAWQAISLEAALRPELRPLVVQTNEQLAGWGVEFFRLLRTPDPTRDFWIVMALFDGLMAQQLATPDPIFDPASAFRKLLRGLTIGTTRTATRKPDE